jgi:hypothetical protein
MSAPFSVSVTQDFPGRLYLNGTDRQGDLPKGFLLGCVVESLPNNKVELLAIHENLIDDEIAILVG